LAVGTLRLLGFLAVFNGLAGIDQSFYKRFHRRWVLACGFFIAEIGLQFALHTVTQD
jgi:hypothetical protein